ncbi:MAG: glycosyltransferase family 4 protein [Ferruginibacter sp.]
MLIVFSGNTSWGMYNFRMGMMKNFIDLGYEVCVVAPEDEYTDNIKLQGIRFIPLKNLKRFSINPIHDLRLYLEYIKIYKLLQPAFIFHYTIKPNIYGTLAAKISKTRSISITTGLGNAFSRKGAIFYFAKYLYKLSSAFALEVWFLNSTDKETFLTHHIIPDHKCFILPGEGVNTRLFTPAVPYPQNEITSFLLVSRMQYDKGIQLFVEACRLLKQKGAQFSSLLLGEIAAGNPEAISLDTIEEWQREGIITYLGNTTDVKKYFREVHAVVLPSYYKEGIPRVLLEAACMEKPIITTRNQGCTDVVDDGITGYLCEIKNANDLADKMQNFINLSPAEKRKMGIAGRKKMEESFDEKIIIDIYKRKFEQYALTSAN